MKTRQKNQNEAAVWVLTNHGLLTTIVGFSSGVSYFAHQVRQQLVCTHKNLQDVSPRDVALWQDAVCSGDRRTLEALHQLSQTTGLREALFCVLDGIVAYAFAQSSDLELLEWICDSFPAHNHLRLDNEQERVIGERGDVAVVELLLSRGFGVSDAMCEGAGSKGHLDLIKLLYAPTTKRAPFECVRRVMNAAAANGHLAAVQFVQEHLPGCTARFCGCRTYHVMDEAASHGHFEVVKYLHTIKYLRVRSSRMGMCTTGAMDGAATNGHLEIVKFLHSKRREGCTTRSMDGAVENRHFETIQFLHENRTEGCSRQAMIDAIARDDFETLKLLADNRGEGTLEGALQFAGECGLLKYIRHLFDASERASIPIILPREDLVNIAATKGNVELIKFFHEREYFRFSPKAMHNAATAKHLHVVKFLHENRSEGCKVDTLFECDQKGLRRIVDYLCASRPMSNPTKAIARAKREGRLLLAAKLEYSAANAKETYAYK